MAKRRVRMDKGRVARTLRVEKAVPFIIEMQEVDIPHLQILLGRLADKTPAPTNANGKPTRLLPVGPVLSLTRTLNLVRKWKDAGWIEYRNPYRDKDRPASVYATRLGLKEFGYGHLEYSVRSVDSLQELFDAVHYRLWLGREMHRIGYRSGWKWHSQRVLRAEYKNDLKYPDAEVVFGSDIAAIEIERSWKSPKEYEKIRNHYDVESAGYSGWRRAKEYTIRTYVHADHLATGLRSVFGPDLFQFRPFSQLYLEDGSVLT